MLLEGMVGVCWRLYGPKRHPREEFLPGDLEHGNAWKQKARVASLPFAHNLVFAAPKLSSDLPILHTALKDCFQALGMRQSGLSSK